MENGNGDKLSGDTMQLSDLLCSPLRDILLRVADMNEQASINTVVFAIILSRQSCAASSPAPAPSLMMSR